MLFHMSKYEVYMNWLIRLFRRGRLEEELERELADHVEQRIHDLTAEGLEAKEAARRARLEFGTSDEIKEACRDVRGTRWLEDLIHDCRYGIRTLRRNPAFTFAALMTLAIGIGANAA